MAGQIKIAIMQPYFLPYIGYWQLMNAVDQFVVYDNIQFTKKGWINRNRYLLDGKAEIFTLPLKKDSDYLDIRDRYLSDNFDGEAKKILRRCEAAYRKAPYFKEGYEVLQECLTYDDKNLFNFIFHSIEVVKNYLNIDTELVVSSQIDIEHSLRSAEKVKAICKSLSASNYVNPIGGISLYDKKDFDENNISLRFLQSQETVYQQFDNKFIPWLSIIDMIMFCSKCEITSMSSKIEYS
jgi:hypothetical protein